GGELPDGRHLLGLDELALQALAIGDVDADELHPAARAVLDVARVGEHGDQLAPAGEEVEVVAARMPALERAAPEGGRAGALARGMEVLEGPPAELLAAVAEQALGHVVDVEERAGGRVHHEDAGRGAVDGPPVARLLLEQLLAVGGLLAAQLVLARLDEEVGDVQDAFLELLAEELAELVRLRRIVRELALDVLDEGPAEIRPLGGDLAQARVPEVAGDALEMARERGFQRGAAHVSRLAASRPPWKPPKRPRARATPRPVVCSRPRVGVRPRLGSHGPFA